MHAQTHRMDQRIKLKELKFTISFRIIYFVEWDKRINPINNLFYGQIVINSNV